MGCDCSSSKIQPRCVPSTVTEMVLGDDDGNVLVDDYEVAISMSLTRSGAGIEFEYNREEATT